MGASGNCAPFNVLAQNNLSPLHAVLSRNGNVLDLGDLGGDGKFAGIYATGLNDEGQIVGTSDTTGDASFHGFIWQQGHITDLGTLPGDSYSSATSIGNNGMVQGLSISASFSPRAAIWHNGIATDMNTLVPPDSAFCLESACSIRCRPSVCEFAFSMKKQGARQARYWRRVFYCCKVALDCDLAALTSRQRSSASQHNQGNDNRSLIKEINP